MLGLGGTWNVKNNQHKYCVTVNNALGCVLLEYTEHSIINAHRCSAAGAERLWVIWVSTFLSNITLLSVFIEVHNSIFVINWICDIKSLSGLKGKWSYC